MIEEEETPEEPILLGSNREGMYIPPYGPVSRSGTSMRARGPESIDDFQNFDSCHGSSSGLGYKSSSGPGSGPGSVPATAESAVAEMTIGIVMEDNIKKNFVHSRSDSIEEELKKNQTSEVVNRGNNSDIGVINITKNRNGANGRELNGGNGNDAMSPRVSTRVLNNRTNDIGVDDEKGVITVRRLNSLVASIVRTAGTEIKKKNQFERKESYDRERAKKCLADEKDENDRISTRDITLSIDPDRSSGEMGMGSRKESTSFKRGGGRERAVSGAVPHDDVEDVYATPSENNLSNHVVLIAGVGPNPVHWAPANTLILPIIFFIKAIRGHSGDKIIVLCERAQELIPLIGNHSFNFNFKLKFNMHLVSSLKHKNII